MGWVLKDPARSDALRTAHRTAVAWFSVVTIAFQVWFLWAVFGLSESMPVLAGLVACLLVVGLVIVRGMTGGAPTPVVSCSLWLLSAGTLSAVAVRHGFQVPRTEFTAASSGVQLVAPVCVFGFALCPYLDATFHHACRQGSVGATPRAFGFGFGVLFSAMILGTLFYAPSFIASDTTFGITESISWVAVLLTVHVTLQACYTVVAHRLTATRRYRAGVNALVGAAIG